MSNYYFVTSALPSLQVGEAPDCSFHEFSALVDLNIYPHDKVKVEVIRRYYDINNLRAYWQDEPFDPRGTIPAADMEEVILLQEVFPAYVFDFIQEHEQNEDALRYFPHLLATFFNQEIEQADGFLKEYLNFEREWRLVMLGFRAKKLGRDVSAELQFEDPSDTLVAQIIAQKDGKTYEPPYGYEDLKGIFDTHHDHPMDLHKALCVYRFNKVQALTEGDTFSIDALLATMVQLIIVEQWEELNNEQGTEIVDSIVKETL